MTELEQLLSLNGCKLKSQKLQRQKKKKFAVEMLPMIYSVFTEGLQIYK